MTDIIRSQIKRVDETIQSTVIKVKELYADTVMSLSGEQHRK